MPQLWNLFCLCCKQTDYFAIPLLKKHNRQSVTRNRQATRYETCQQDTHTDNYINPTLRPGRDELQPK